MTISVRARARCSLPCTSWPRARWRRRRPRWRCRSSTRPTMPSSRPRSPPRTSTASRSATTGSRRWCGRRTGSRSSTTRRRATSISGPRARRRQRPAPKRAGYEPVTLFIGTEKGFTYRLTLLPAARASAQILIRNADAVPSSVAFAASPPAGEPHIAALVRLVRAVAAREPLPGTAIHAGGGSLGAGIRLIETWRGTGAFPRPRFAALVFEAARPASQDADDSAGLAGTIGSLPGIGPVAALWLAPPATGPSGGRLGVAVVETAGAGDPR